ncbi:MAG: hypothetical protein AABZ60_04615 [Planctomycetota bacterium]
MAKPSLSPNARPAWASGFSFFTLLNHISLFFLILFFLPFILLLSHFITVLNNKLPKPYFSISLDWKNMLLDLGILVLYFISYQNTYYKPGKMTGWFTQKFEQIRSFYYQHAPLPTFLYFFFPLLWLFSKVRRQEIMMFFRLSLLASLLGILLNLPDFYYLYQELLPSQNQVQQVRQVMPPYSLFKFILGSGVSLSINFLLNTPIFLLFFLPLNATFIRYYFEGRVKTLVFFSLFIILILTISGTLAYKIGWLQIPSWIKIG